MDWKPPDLTAVVDDRLVELPDLVLSKIIRELIFVNDARNIRRAYVNSDKFIAIFDATWEDTVARMQVSGMGNVSE